VTPCPACGGTGRKPLPYEPANEAWALSQQPECRACDGTGEACPETEPEPRPDCRVCEHPHADRDPPDFVIRGACDGYEPAAPEPDPAEVTAAARAGRCLPVGTLRVRV